MFYIVTGRQYSEESVTRQYIEDSTENVKGRAHNDGFRDFTFKAITPKPTAWGISCFRSFDPTGVLLDSPAKINVLIGKNNCGKSNILKFLRSLKVVLGSSSTSLDQIQDDRHWGSPGAPRAVCRWPITTFFQSPPVLKLFERLHVSHLSVFTDLGNGATVVGLPPSASKLNWQSEQIPYIDAVEYATKEAMNHNELDRAHIRMSAFVGSLSKQYFRELAPRVLYLPDFRHIRTSGNPAPDDQITGDNIIVDLHAMQHPLPGNDVLQERFSRIEQQIKTLLQLDKLKLEISSDKSAIILNMHGKRLAIESFGAGIHQLVIFCLMFTLYEKKVICIEEPELHMHPELQRRMLRFMLNTDNTYYITTHSNVFLDPLEDVRVHHVSYDGTASKVDTIDTPARARTVVSDLGCLASDLIQSNCVVWVEGPSDRIFLLKWLSLFDSALVERLHFSVFFYGGACRSAVSCDPDDPNDDLVSLLHINRHAYVLMDRDGATTNEELGPDKRRVLRELGDKQCWISDGREIENYITQSRVDAFAKDIHPDAKSGTLDKNMRIREHLQNLLIDTSKSKFDYADRKVFHARRIANRFEQVDLDVLDLRMQLERLAAYIRECNGQLIDPPPT